MDPDYTSDVTRAITSNSAVLEDDGTIYVIASGNQDGDSIRALDDKVRKMIEHLDYKPNILIDVRNTGFPDASGRKAIIDSFNEDNYNKQAIFGLSESLRVIAVIVLGRVMLRDRTKLCKDEASARAWLAQYPAKLAKKDAAHNLVK